jgi:hypothetical protein
VGALLYKVDSGPWLVAGAGPTTITAPPSGELYLAYNDNAFSDNYGDYTVAITACDAVVSGPPTVECEQPIGKGVGCVTSTSLVDSRYASVTNPVDTCIRLRQGTTVSLTATGDTSFCPFAASVWHSCPCHRDRC